MLALGWGGACCRWNERGGPSRGEAPDSKPAACTFLLRPRVSKCDATSMHALVGDKVSNAEGTGSSQRQGKTAIRPQDAEGVEGPHSRTSKHRSKMLASHSMNETRPLSITRKQAHVDTVSPQ